MEITEIPVKKKAYQPSQDEVVFNLDEWDLKTDFNIMGTSKIIHHFEYALISRDNRTVVIPVTVLTGSKQDRMDSLVLLYLRSKDLGTPRRFCISSQTVSPYENFLSGIFNVPVVRSILLSGDEKSVRITADGISQRENNTEMEIEAKEKPIKHDPETVREEKSDTVSRHRRDHTMIMHDILSLARSYGNLGITNIIYRCNLNYRSALRAVNELLDNRLLEISDTGGAKQKYKITQEGISKLEEIRRFSFTRTD